MDQQPFFSIIVPSYNRAAILAECLQQILTQTFQSFEVIVVDDGSTDNTADVVAALSDSRIRYFKTENRERSHARNYGAAHAQGTYLNFFDSDDWMYPSRLQEVYAFIRTQGNPPVMFTQYDFVNEHNEVVGKMERHYNSFTKDILFNNFLATNAVFIKRELAVTFPFHDDRRIITAEDWELWLRVHAAFDFVEYKKSTFAIREHAGRSLATIPAHRIVARDTYFATLVAGNEAMIQKFGARAVKLFMADRFTFIALSLIIEKDKKGAATYLLRALKTSRGVISRKRFWAVLKKLV